MAIRVIAVEDHPLMLKAIREELSSDPDILVVGELTRGSDLARVVREKQPDVLLLDLALSGEPFEPITAVRNLTQANPKLRILILTGYDDPRLMHSLIEAGALGYILKSDDLSMELPKAVKVIYSGKPFYSAQVIEKLITVPHSTLLTDQEMATLRLLARGLPNDEIAAAMNVSAKRVSNVLTAIYSKLNVSNDKNVNPRVASVNKARELGLLDES